MTMPNNRFYPPEVPEQDDEELEQESTEMESPEPEPEPKPTPKKKRRGDDMSDLFEVPQPEDNDIYTDDLVALDSEDVYGGDENMDDLLTVSHEDIMGKPLTSRKSRRMKRTQRLYNQPTSMGGMQG